MAQRSDNISTHHSKAVNLPAGVGRYNSSLSDLLYQATDCGRRIIEDLFPESQGVFGTKKKFKMRLEEKTPSAEVFLKDNIWRAIDYGGEGIPQDPIQLYAYQHNLDWTSALQALLNIYNVVLPRFNADCISYEAKGIDDKKGDFSYEPGDFDQDDLKLFGPNVTKQHLEQLGWRKVRKTRIVLEDCVVIKSSIIGRPLFVRECRCFGNEETFYKLYDPANPDKQYRFSHYGHKSKNYINGYYESKLMHENETACGISPSKCKPVVIASGDRDAVNVLSMDYKVVYFNSETYKPSDNDMMLIKELGPNVYLIPDIDDTGRREGKKMALRFPWLKVAWLPSDLLTHKDWRGYPMKDLRDWMSLGHNNSDFNHLINLAPAADYFVEKENGNIYINVEYLHNFLHLNNYGTIEVQMGETKQRKMVRLNGYILEIIEDYTEIINFLKNNLPSNYRHNEKYNLLLSSRAISERTFQLMPSIEGELDKPEKGIERIYFKNCVVTITAGGIEVIKASDYKGLVLENSVIKHNFTMPKELPLLFDFSNPREPIIKEYISNSYLLLLLINTSRIYWQEEYKRSGLKLQDYYDNYNGMITSEFLTEDENRKQYESLNNKLFNLGYLLTSYKSKSEPKAVFIMDAFSTPDNRNNGGTGKGTITSALNKVVSCCQISGRDSKILQNNHCYDRVTPSTRIIIVDDYNPTKVTMGFFYPNITDGLTVNPKGKNSFHLGYEQSPKFVFTSNSVPENLDPSTIRRLYFCPVGDWYHEKTDSNRYPSSHAPKDDFGIDLMQDYTEEQWNADFALMMQCIQYYSHCNVNQVKVDAQAEILEHRINKELVNEDFQEWADVFFADSQIFGKKLERKTVFESYIEFTGDRAIRPKKFKKIMMAYLEENGIELNNCVDRQKDGRVIGTNANGTSVEYFYFSKIEDSTVA